MALIPATITVNFISNYAGQHRICWRTGGAGAYDCSTLVTCTGGGAACSATIAVTVDHETCDDVIFDGYVQATCEDEGSLSGRVPFTVTFSPVQPCTMYVVECTSVPVARVEVLTRGNSYTPGATLPLTFVGGGGTAAAGNAIVGDGGILTWTISSGGSNYVSGGFSGVVTSVPASNLMATGSGAVFDVTVTAGAITSIALSSDADCGTGYGMSDTFEFSNTYFGNSGSGVVITVTAVNTGMVAYTTLTLPGSGYTSVPTADAGGSATFLVVLDTCATLDLGDDCEGNPIDAQTGLALGDQMSKCGTVAPTPAAGYTVTESGCCYDCETALFTNLDSDNDLFVTYIDCTTLLFTEANVVFGVPLEVCIVTGSHYYDHNQGTIATTPGCVL